MRSTSDSATDRSTSGCPEQRSVVERPEVGDELGETVAVGLDEVAVDRAALDEPPVDPLEQGEVGADGDGHVEVGERRASADDAAEAAAGCGRRSARPPAAG